MKTILYYLLLVLLFILCYCLIFVFPLLLFDVQVKGVLFYTILFALFAFVKDLIPKFHIKVDAKEAEMINEESNTKSE